MVCSKCGTCCKYQVVEVQHQIYTQSDMNYYNYHDIIFERKNRNVDYKLIPCRCKYLGEDNLCKIFHNRPDICDKNRRGNHRVYRFKQCTDEG